MDETHFDFLTRRLSLSSTRRRFWKAAGGGMLGLASGSVQARPLPRCFGKKTRQPCSGRNFCCGIDVCDYSNPQSYYAETVKRCCRPLDSPCMKHLDCCGFDVLCQDGVCISA
jgi:hypothetical protein